MKRLIYTLLTAGLLGCGHGSRGTTAGGDTDSVATVSSLTVYLERSGSMVAYDTPDGDGNLKRAVNDVINGFGHADSVTINIVNDSVYPYGGTLATFLQDRDIYGSTAGTGNAAYTDFNLIFTQMLSSLRPGHVAVLVSDLIYSPRGIEGVSLDKLFTEERSVVRAVFGAHRDVDVVVHRFVGDYHGKYYPALGGSFDYHGKRPFFMLVVADRATMSAVRASEHLSAVLLHPATAQGSYVYSNVTATAPSVLLPRYDGDRGRWRVSRDGALTLTACRADEQGHLAFTVAANLSAVQVDSLRLLDPAAYTVNTERASLTVTPVTEDIITGNNRRYLDGKTHLLTIDIDRYTGNETVTVTLPHELPQWVRDNNATSDNNPAARGFAEQTLGLLPLLQGIDEARGGTGSPDVEISVTLKN